VNIADEKAVEKCRKLFRSSDEPRKIFLVLESNNERCSLFSTVIKMRLY